MPASSPAPDGRSGPWFRPGYGQAVFRSSASSHRAPTPGSQRSAANHEAARHPARRAPSPDAKERRHSLDRHPVSCRERPTDCRDRAAGQQQASPPPATEEPPAARSWRPADTIHPRRDQHPPSAASESRCAGTRSASAAGSPLPLAPRPRLLPRPRSIAAPDGGTPPPSGTAPACAPCT